MRKFIRLFLIILSAILLFVGCTDDYVIDETKTVVHKSLYKDIDKLKSLNEDESLIEEKEEYKQLFKKLAGFSLPNSFIFPKETNLNKILIEDNYIYLYLNFIMEKKDALDILEVLKKDITWDAYLYWNRWFMSAANDHNHNPNQNKTPSDSSKVEKKHRERCTAFYKRDKDSFDWIFLNFHYNKEHDCYIILLWSSFTSFKQSGDGELK